MKDVRRLFRLFSPHVPAAIVAILAMLGVAFFTTLVVYLFGPVFDDVLTPRARAEMGTTLPSVLTDPSLKKTALIGVLDDALAKALAAANVPPERRGTVLLVLLFVAFLGKNLCAFAAEYRFNAVGLAFVRDLRLRLYDRILAQAEPFFVKHPSGDLIARVTGDVDRIQTLFGTDLADLVQSVATLVFLSILVVARSPELTGVAFFVAPAILLPVVLIAKRLRSLSRAGREEMGGLTGVLSETIRGRRVVQAYGAESYESERFQGVNDRTFRLSRKGARVMAFSSPLVETASVVAFLLLLFYAQGRIASGTLTFGTFVSFGVGLVMMYQPFKRATRTNLALQHALVSARRLFEVLDAEVEVREKEGARPLAPFTKQLALENVSFRYGDGPLVLDGVSLVLPRGTVTAIVGPSGAGKSTLANLLPRFMDPVGGRITIDGIDVRDLTLASLRGSMGLVTQDVVLFDDTVRRNVAYGRDADESRLRSALEAANALAFVEALPQRLETRVGEGGARLSGGQKQRLAIARALVKDPPILLLDEATSALDTESERAVQEALERLMQGRTVVVIAHRLSTVRRADQIVVLEHGVLKERGTHTQLLAEGGLYKRLYDLSSFEEDKV
ncbi:MAG: ABC transporter ATP-binding protein [Acidobacteria bacterium]|nr:ABC transporter ATP-binding protein [Acidobacteriota bacterium]